MLCSQGGCCSLCCVHKVDIVVYAVFTRWMLWFMLCSQGGCCSLCCVHREDVVVYVVFTRWIL